MSPLSFTPANLISSAAGQHGLHILFVRSWYIWGRVCQDRSLWKITWYIGGGRPVPSKPKAKSPSPGKNLPNYWPTLFLVLPSFYAPMIVVSWIECIGEVHVADFSQVLSVWAFPYLVRTKQDGCKARVVPWFFASPLKIALWSARRSRMCLLKVLFSYLHSKEVGFTGVHRSALVYSRKLTVFHSSGNCFHLRVVFYSCMTDIRSGSAKGWTITGRDPSGAAAPFIRCGEF